MNRILSNTIVAGFQDVEDAQILKYLAPAGRNPTLQVYFCINVTSKNEKSFFKMNSQNIHPL